MRTALIALSLTTVTFAASTAYLAYELHAERTRSASEPRVPLAASAPPAPGREPRPTPAPVATKSKLSLQAGVSEQPAAREGELPAQQRQYFEELLARLQDPEQRTEMLAEYEMISRNSNPRLAQALLLSDHEYERLIELMATGQVNGIESSAHCSLDPQCNAHGIGRREADWKTQEIANLLGPERQQKFNEYRNSLAERESVAQLRGRLTDSAFLSEGQAEALILALADERQRITIGGGNSTMAFGNGSGMAYITAQGDSPEERFKSAQENSQRLRARAAEVLTPEQLRVFNEMQDDVVLSARQQLRQKQQFTAVADPAPN